VIVRTYKSGVQTYVRPTGSLPSMGQREDLLAAAKELLVEKGYHRTTARDIAALSGAHLGSIGYHYGSKDGLMTAAAIELQGEWGAAIETGLAAVRAAGPTRRLQVAVDELVAAMSQQPEVLAASVQAYAQAAFDADIRETLTTATRGARTDLAAGILGADPADIDADSSRGLGSVVHALIAGLSLQAFLDPDSLPTGAHVVQAINRLAAEQ
jgi:AcrR family transcriptional regulator